MESLISTRYSMELDRLDLGREKGGGQEAEGERSQKTWQGRPKRGPVLCFPDSRGQCPVPGGGLGRARRRNLGDLEGIWDGMETTHNVEISYTLH